jgi:hypothetical protein
MAELTINRNIPAWLNFLEKEILISLSWNSYMLILLFSFCIEVQITYKIFQIYVIADFISRNKTKNKLHGLSPRANCTDRATAACRRSDCQLLPIKSATWSA